MRAYINDTQSQSQSQLHQNALRNLLKDAAMAPIRQRQASGAPSPTSNTHANRDIFLPNSKFNNITQEEHMASIDLKKDAVAIGRDYETSKEDALEHLNSPTYKMDAAVESGLSVVHQNKDQGLSNERDFSFAGANMAGFDSDTLRQDVDYIASRYVVMQERINEEFTGEERTANLKKLEEAINTATEKLAQSFSGAMADAFGENGVSIDKESLRQGVYAAVDQSTARYADFVKSNKEYADISGPEENWLRKDSAYMASELRKAAGTNSSGTTAEKNPTGFTLDEMEKMHSFTKELESYSTYVTGSTKEVQTGNESEESLGMKLADLTLKGRVFNDYANVSDKVKDMVNKSIENFVTTAIEAEQAHMDKWSALQIQAINKSTQKGAYSTEQAKIEIENIRKNFSDVDNDAVYAVINKVVSSYESTGDVNKALMEGAVFAKNTYERKAQGQEYAGIGRYNSGKRYWNNFFSNKDKYDSNIDPLGFKRDFNGYIQKESGLDSIVHSWNAFMEKATSNANAMLSKADYLAYA